MEKGSTINYWGKPRSHKAKPQKKELLESIRGMLPKVIDINNLTIKDLIRLERALQMQTSTAEFSNCKTKAEYISALSIAAPGVTNFNRLSLRSLKDLSEVFHDRTFQTGFDSRD